MADGTSDAVEDVTLEGPAATWLAQRADALDLTTAAFLERLVAAYRVAEEGEGPDVVTEAEFEEQLQDVRDRVIQVKRETDGKASADHDHPDLTEQTAEALAAVDELESAVADLASTQDRLSNRVDGGFENFEEVLTYLRDETDRLDGKLTTLATAVLAMREAVASVAAANARRERTDSLKRAANREHVRVADCEDCESEVDVSLLTAPECPFCGATFEDVAATRGWFGSHTLVTGSVPALTAGDSALDDEDAWLGAETATLEEMASGDADSDDGPEIVEPSTVEDPAPADPEPRDDGSDDADSTGSVEDGEVGAGDGTRGDDTVDRDAGALDLDDEPLDLDGEPVDFDDEALDLNDEDLNIDEDTYDFGGDDEDVRDDKNVRDDGETDA